MADDVALVHDGECYLPVAVIGPEAEIVSLAEQAEEMVLRQNGRAYVRLGWAIWEWPAREAEWLLRAAGWSPTCIKGSSEVCWQRAGFILGAASALRRVLRERAPPACPRCGKAAKIDPWGEAFFDCHDNALCGLCNRETGSGIRSRCMQCLMSGRVDAEGDVGGL